MKIQMEFSGFIALVHSLDDLPSVWTRPEMMIQRDIPTKQSIRNQFISFNCYAVVDSLYRSRLCFSIVNCCGILFRLLKPLCKRATQKKRIDFGKGSLRMWCNQSQLKLWMTSTWSARAILIEVHDQRSKREVWPQRHKCYNKWDRIVKLSTFD